MAITPQAIKDQEFQVKFRGYDTIEVKAYLELIAEEFFERLEELRQQVEEIETLSEGKADLEDEKESLQQQMASMKEKEELDVSESGQKNEQISNLNDECDMLREEIKTLEEENADKDEEITAAEERVEEKEKEILDGKAKQAELQQEMEIMRRTSEKLGEAEIDFKSTLVMAQKFANEIKEKSEAEAQEIIDIAIQESEKLRQDTFNQLARYPKEIEKLKEKRNTVYAELSTALTTCLQTIDVLDEVGADVALDEVDDLYQSIDLPLEDEPDMGELEEMEGDFSAPAASDESDNSFPDEAEQEEVSKNSEVIVS